MLAPSDIACPSDAEINDFCAGRLPTHRFQHLLDHLDQCSSCQQRTDSEPPSDPFVAAIAGTGNSPAEDPVLAEADCQAALFHAVDTTRRQWDAVLPPVETLGPYRLLRPLGQGGMGAVYLAEHERLKKLYAIKLLPRERGFNTEWVERFDRETRAVASLKHPGIVTATDAGDANGWHYLVMEYLDGFDLAAAQSRLDSIAVEDAILLCVQLCDALASVHDAGLVHRDIKPSNVMLTSDGTVKLLDLGLVLENQAASGDFRLTTVGHILGTLAFAAPEQLTEGGPISPATDLYGVGATLFQLVAGRPAHTVERGLAPLIVSKTNQEAVNLQTYRPDAPQELCELVANLLKRDPLQRPSEAREVASRLEAMLPNIDATARVKRLRSLAKRTAQSSNASATNSANSVPWSPTLATNVSQRSSDGGRRNKWLAGFLAGGAAALLAGLLLYVKTDRGTLVIESDLEDVQVSFSQEGKPAENFEVHSGENRTVLKTGSYQVQVDASGESVQFSPQQVVIQRGEETILKVRRIDGIAPSADSLAGKNRSTPSKDQTETFRGQPLSYWIETLKTERDVDSLGEAMDAVTVLANTKDVELAKAILIAARDYGGWSSSTPGNAKKLSDRSMHFMHYFNLYFQRMMPEPGLIVIADELKQDNPRSRAACLWACISMDEEKWQAWANASASSQTAIQLQEQVQRLLIHPNDNESVLGLQYEGYNRNALLSIGYRLALSSNPAIPQIPALKTELQRRISEVDPPKEFAERMTEFLKVATSNKTGGIGGNSGGGMGGGGMGGVYASANQKPVLTIEDVLLARKYNLEIPLPLQVQALVNANKSQWDAAQAELTILFTESPEDVSNEIWLALGLSSSSDYSNGGMGGMGGIPHASLLLQESIPMAASESETNPQSSLLIEAARQTTHPDLVGAALAAAASTWWTRTYTKGEAEMEKVVGELAEAWKIAKKRSAKQVESNDSQPADSFSFTWENNNPFESLPPKPIVTGGMF